MMSGETGADMSPRAAWASLAVLVLATAAEASSIVLTDGQVINGTAVERKGDAYLVTMDGGNTVSFPAALVKEVKLDAEAAPEAPPGFDYSGPKTLAGPAPSERASQHPRDQLKILGPPTQWTKDIIDPTWVPTNAFDPEKDVLAGSRSTWSKSAVDTTWYPTSGLDMKKDVFAKSRATWAESIVDTTWKPTDGFGFKPLWPSAPRPQVIPEVPKQETDMRPEPPAPPELASLATPWTCAEALFARDGKPTSMTVRTLGDRVSGALGIPLYEASGTLRGVPRKAVYTIDRGECRMVGGDAGVLTGTNLPADHTIAQDAASLNVALSAKSGPRIPVGVDELEYALAFVTVIDPAVSGTTGATLTRIESPDQLRSIVSKPPLTCSVGKTQRRKEERAATNAFLPPKAESAREGNVVTFLTWSSQGGTLTRHRVIIGNDGVRASRTVVAAHLGAHKD
jgi:hypothetical protein